jgi:hypothetical protein
MCHPNIHRCHVRESEREVEQQQRQQQTNGLIHVIKADRGAQPTAFWLTSSFSPLAVV